MGEEKWGMARREYLLAKQLQGLSQRLITYLTDNRLEFTASSIRVYLASLTVGQVTLGIMIN